MFEIPFLSPLWRFWCLAFEYLQHQTKDNYFSARHVSFLFTYDCWRYGSWFRKAWRLSHRICRQSRIPLPVLQKLDAPCEGCGGRCCHKPKGEAGFTDLVVYRWEEFARRHADRLQPHRNNPTELVMKFNDRCPFLTRDGKCDAYDHRPVACMSFNCVDGLAGVFSCATKFVNRVPEVKNRLIQLGFKSA